MKVKMIVTTSWMGSVYWNGQLYSVPDEVAIRWVRNRIADEMPDVDEVVTKAVTNDQLETKPKIKRGRPAKGAK